jgi:molybdopterin-guanine dinucleotide biosynthesis protein A
MIAFIQAGGRSSRMGEDKAWLSLDGRPMIERVLAAAQAAAGLAIVINAASPEAEAYRRLAAQWGARLLHDLHERRGPLGGIHTALVHCAEGEAALILACDLPFLTPELLAILRRFHQEARSDLTLPTDQAGRLQPLAAIYAASCRAPIAHMLAENQLKVDLLCPRVATRRVAFAEIAHLPGAERFFININTPEDYRAALKLSGTSPPNG